MLGRDRGRKLGGGGGGQAQGLRKQSHRFALRVSPVAALQGSDAVRADARLFGQHLLREPGRQPVAPQ
jgi:hypothetical protein